MSFDTIIFAVITVVVFLKLKKEFGKISGDDEARKKIIDILKEQKKDSNNKVIDITPQIKANRKEQKKDGSFYSGNLKILEKTVKEKIEKDSKIKSVLKDLDLSLFLRGADNALEISIEAFSKKDLETLKMLLSKNLYSEFKKELDSAKDKKQEIKSSIISVIKKRISSVEVKNKFVYIDVKFKTEQINFIEDEDKKVVSGDKNKIEIIEEIWSFKKDINPKNINWKIIGITDVK